MSTPSPPTKYGMIVFNGFQALDVFGPLSILNVLSRTTAEMSLSILADSLSPISTHPTPNPGFLSSRFGQSILPTHTFATAPPDIEVLLVPGGFGTQNAKAIAPVLAFVEKVFPRLQHVVTICTGSGILARAGLLDNRRATTNKSTFSSVVKLGPRVHWVPRARWVVDRTPGVTPVWSSSGVSAGMDVTLAFIAGLYGEDIARNVANVMEYTRWGDGGEDPFADVWKTETETKNDEE